MQLLCLAYWFTSGWSAVILLWWALGVVDLRHTALGYFWTLLVMMHLGKPPSFYIILTKDRATLPARAELKQAIKSQIC